MSYAPNVDAVVYFTNEVFPEVRPRLPEGKFVIVGIQLRRRFLN